MAARKQAEPKPARAPRMNASALVEMARLVTTKDAEEFEAQAHALAETLGFVGEPEWVLNGVQVKDAKMYLVKVLHEIHVAALNPGKTIKIGKEDDPEIPIDFPKAQDVAMHLGFQSGSDEFRAIQDVITDVRQQEQGQ